MKALLFHVVLCPQDATPKEDNIEHVHVVSADIPSALKFASKNYEQRSIVSVSLAQPVLVDGSIVDFE